MSDPFKGHDHEAIAAENDSLAWRTAAAAAGSEAGWR
jgi:hypothetical protein